MNKKKLIIVGIIVIALGMICGGVLGWKFISHERKQGKKISSLSKKQKELTAEIDSLTNLIDELNGQLEAVQKDEEEFEGVYRKLKNGEDIKVAVIGDSIGAGCGASDYEHMWATKLIYWIQDTYNVKCDYVNPSLGGNTSYAGYVTSKLLDPEKSYDLAIICYGQNDAQEGFSYCYEAIIRSLYMENEKCTIIPVLESSQHTYTQKMVDIRNLADFYHLDYADTIAAFNANPIGLWGLLADGTHPNDDGHQVYFETVKAIIERGVDEEKGYIPMQTIPYNGGVDGFDSFTYLSKEQFTQISDTVFEIEMEPTWGIFGISRTLLPGSNSINIYVDDELYITDSVTSNLDYGVMKINGLNAGPTEIKGKVRIEFPDTEQVDAFNGLILTQG